MLSESRRRSDGTSSSNALSEDERDHMQVIVRRGKANARTLTRVLLKSDESFTDAESDRSQMEHDFASFG
jgi:hypothetical protein